MISQGLDAAPRIFRVANWSAVAHFDDQSKQFVRCSANSPSLGGVGVAYSVDRQFRWSLMIWSADWNFTPGFMLNMNLKLDERGFRALAVAVESRSFEIQVEDSIAVARRNMQASLG